MSSQLVQLSSILDRFGSSSEQDETKVKSRETGSREVTARKLLQKGTFPREKRRRQITKYDITTLICPR